MAFLSFPLLYIFFVGAVSVFADDPPAIFFLKKGKSHKSFSVDSLKSVQKDEVLNVFEPHENVQKKYRGFPVLPLIEMIYGKNLDSPFDTLVFYCDDGYRSDVPLTEFKVKKATLSFAMADGSPFVLKSEKPISLSPLYLTWDHPDAASAKKTFFRWPYRIQKIDFVESASAYKAIVPTKDSDQVVQTGQREFLKHCFSCHALNEVGGFRGPPLNYFVQEKTASHLEKYILNPKSFDQNSQMAGLPADLPERQKIAAEIVSYLKKQSR